MHTKRGNKVAVRSRRSAHHAGDEQDTRQQRYKLLQTLTSAEEHDVGPPCTGFGTRWLLRM